MIFWQVCIFEVGNFKLHQKEDDESETKRGERSREELSSKRKARRRRRRHRARRTADDDGDRQRDILTSNDRNGSPWKKYGVLSSRKSQTPHKSRSLPDNPKTLNTAPLDKVYNLRVPPPIYETRTLWNKQKQIEIAVFL